MGLFIKADSSKKTSNVSLDETPISYKLDLEQSREKSKRLAWIIAGVSVGCVICLSLAIAFLTPLKEVKPYVIRVDNTTGYVDIVTDIKQKDISASEAMDKYFLSRYIENREGYHFNTAREEYRNTLLMTAPNAVGKYSAKFTGDKSPIKVLKNDYEVNIKILSIQLLKGKASKVAIVRFEAIQQVPNSEIDEGAEKDLSTISTRYTANIEYEYALNKYKLSEEQRLKNPLGFVVTSYRLDQEVAQ